MPKRTTFTQEQRKIGPRLAFLRKAAGLTQRELAKELGISQRMVAYYEKHAETIPAQLILPLTNTLGVSLEDIFEERHVDEQTVKDTKLWSRFKEVELLPAKERKKIVALLDTFLEKERLKNAAKEHA